MIRAWTPWAILTVFVGVWGLPPVKAAFNGIFAPAFPIDGLHNLVEKMPPVVAKVATKPRGLNGFGCRPPGTRHPARHHRRRAGDAPTRRSLLKVFRTLWLVRYSLLTIVLMLALGTLTPLLGTDTTLGLAFANTGVFYPFFGTLMGWLGVALTGSDTASNVLFGGMQKVARRAARPQSPNLMGAAVGRRDGQDDRRAVHRRGLHRHRWFNHEGDILRFVFFHSSRWPAWSACT